jgi:galactose-1-phosphate uridylyltransferase
MPGHASTGHAGFFREGEYATQVLHPWFGHEAAAPRRHAIRWRVQPVFARYTTLLATERGNRPFDFSEGPASRPAECGIDQALEQPERPELKQEWAKPHFYFRGQGGAEAWRAMTSLYPFMAPHWWQFLPTHSQDLGLLTRQGIVEAVELAYELAMLMLDRPARVRTDGAEALEKARREFGDQVDGMHWGMNFGPRAGASLGHAHMQVGGLPKASCGEADQEAEFCARHPGIIDRYLAALREYRGERGGLMVRDLGNVLIHAPFAPKVANQVEIALTEPVGNLAQTRPEHRRALGQSLYLVLRGLAELRQRGRAINNVTILAKQTRFENTGSEYRLTLQVMPRETVLGFSEMAGFHVVDRFPEDTASEFRSVIARLQPESA